ncbi:hypothetical protein PHSY_003651 [Pseudozyma hubeiensis SY62]|uniref:Uncharacterized protein n=1 Tax=Pseudozyma hubeiensis (strain SY62) TaxID=1305764 RepID=R9P489_PSEHS|nr:hypothetical protein PHSY_003651 [Pseudozyma hubeiensis SY62]GAC96072.1 hypothetical protein PHSY_003651 [Pseudozyma hubeiensis SY62]
MQPFEERQTSLGNSECSARTRPDACDPSRHCFSSDGIANRMDEHPHLTPLQIRFFEGSLVSVSDTIKDEQIHDNPTIIH